MHFQTPTLRINQSVRDVEELARATGWDVGFRQLDLGPLVGLVTGFGHSDIGVMRVEFNRSYHQLGSAPPGVWTIIWPTKSASPDLYPTRTVALTRVTIPFVSKVVRPYFCTRMPIVASTVVELGVP